MATRPTRTMLGSCVTVLSLVALVGTSAADQPPNDLPACPSNSETPDTAPLLQRVEQSLEGGSSVGTMTMAIKTTEWSRTLKMKVWSKGRDFALVRVLDGGPREIGMMTLKREKQLWNYLPQAGRVMKLPSGMLGDSWMGSDFTNDDLVRGSSLVHDFDAKVTGTLVHDKHNAWRLELVPRASATVVWDRIEIILDTATSGTIRVDGRDLGGMSQKQLSDLRRDRIGFVFQSYNLDLDAICMCSARREVLRYP